MVDRAAYQLAVDGEQVDLTPTEFGLVATLIAAPGSAFSRQELMEHLNTGIVLDGVGRTVDVHIRNLRAKFERDPADPTYIETVYGVDYRCWSKPPCSPEQ